MAFNHPVVFLVQAREVLDSMVLPETKELDNRDKAAVSAAHLVPRAPCHLQALVDLSPLG